MLFDGPKQEGDPPAETNSILKEQKRLDKELYLIFGILNVKYSF